MSKKESEGTPLYPRTGQPSFSKADSLMILTLVRYFDSILIFVNL